ncbi:YncE family protein [Castellaniella defragrans]|uniref:YVTN family beta-propeller protein n=1 Tax=Castellaniella defragrans TaxID=75697 RepID=A0A7W9WQG9_CASDE|nr:YncE family protein [Castellaniella defragrans]KAB0623824.1 YncE family protein [Castellaniella defragrans]MBB6084890.1 YVTN family beta-propeller protein [Castellaniella defragrans]
MRRFKSASFLALVLTAALAGCAQTGDRAASAPAAASEPAQPRVQRQAVGQGIYELVYSARQNALFVAAAGGFGEGAAAPRILRLDPATLAVQAEIPLERKGFGLALDDAAGRLYVGNANDASITVIDTATGKVVGLVQLTSKKVKAPDGKQRYPYNLRELVLDPARHRLYAPGLAFRDSVLYVVDTRSLKVEKVVPGFGFVATGAALDAAGGKLYVSNLQGQLFTVDTASLRREKVAEAGGDQLLNLAFDARTGRVLATDEGMERLDGMREKLGGLKDYRKRGEGNRVVVLDPADGRRLAGIPTGKGPVALLLDAPRQRLFVTNRESGTVTVFDSGSHALLRTVELPAHPNSLALDPRTGAVFVTVKNGRDAPKDSAESVARIDF